MANREMCGQQEREKAPGKIALIGWSFRSPRRRAPARTRPLPRHWTRHVSTTKIQITQSVYSRRILVLLVLSYQILHVRLGLGELHLVHTLLGVPMQERLALEHGRELLADTLEQLLDGSGVADEGNSHLETAGRNVALRGEYVVRDPLDKVRAVLGLHGLHLLLDLLHRDLATEDGGDGEVTAVAGIRGGHHVLRIEHLLRELGNGDSAVLDASPCGQGSETDHEEVQTREGN
jgi:hypothetical protein